MALVVTYISYLTQVLTFAIIARALLSWFPLRYDNPATVLLGQLTDPILRPLKRVIPRLGMLDLSPLVGILILQAIPYVLAQLLL